MNLLVISGGRHPYEESTPVLERFLKDAGHEATVTEDASVLSDAAGTSGYDALVFNTLRAGDNHMTKAEQTGMTNFIKNGKGFVCLHISGCAADDWPEYYDITGGGWISGTSFHPPYGNFTVNISQAGHPGVSGVSEFSTDDELYMGLGIKDGNDVLLTGHTHDGTHPWGPDRAPMEMPGGTFPLGWTRTYGQGKVFTLLLGHDGKSFESPEFQKMVLNGINWATA